jgi:hypothetical protein
MFRVGKIPDGKIWDGVDEKIRACVLSGYMRAELACS